MSAPRLPAHARVVIIGGGIVGCSVAYHLTRRGCRDVLLLERRKLTCGTTWHAAGLVGQLRATHNLTRLAQYTTQLYQGLERETGQATGFRQAGSIAVAASEARFEELERGASMARCFGLEVQTLCPAEAQERWPLLSTEGLVGAVYLPGDGQTNPVDTTRALALGARNGGARLVEDVKVTAIRTTGARATGVATEAGEVRADVVVNCAGMWAREVGGWLNVTVPLHAAEHFYIVTQPIAGLGPLPILRDADACSYFKEDAGKLLVGWFEPRAKPWGTAGIPEDFAFEALPADLDHIEPLLAAAMRRVPLLESTGVQVFFNGPESFTPDDRYLLGETPEVRGLYVAAGFNSIGIQSAGGAGKVLADWIIDGHPPFDLWDVDIRRCAPFQANRRYLRDRTVESLGLLYAMHWPHRQAASARGVRRSALHDRLAVAGACFGEVAGFERPNWFAAAGEAPREEYSYGRANWFARSAAEHEAARERVALFDQTSFAKFALRGRDACAVLQRICANDVDVAAGEAVYTQWLNERGGIEADVTVTREAEDAYLIVTSCATQTRDFTWLCRSLPPDARAAALDLTSAYAVLGLMGPASRELLTRLTDADLTGAAFPSGTSRVVDVGYARVRASRISRVGELGYELYIPTEFAQGVYDVVVEAGGSFGLKLAGYHALDSLRMEKAVRYWGHDMASDDTPLETGLAFAVAWEKPGGFVGREALVRRREGPLSRRLVAVALEDERRLLHHDEPIWRNGVRVGRISSGTFGHTLRAPLGLGYVSSGQEAFGAEWLQAGRYEVEVAGQRVPARVSLEPFYDPAGERVRW